MARPFTAAEALRIIEEHKKIKQSLTNIIAVGNEYFSNIKDASDYLAAQELLKVLSDIPIEEINREKNRFNVKALKENGYKTIADISYASSYSISSIYGISDNAAYSIRNTVDNIIAGVKPGIKIKLSLDNKTPYSSQLVMNISRLRQLVPVADSCSGIIRSFGQSIDSAANDLSAAIGKFDWFFASKQKRMRAVKAYHYLQSLYYGEYGKAVKKLTGFFFEIQNSSAVDAWGDFQENSIRFFNILEAINPGVLGNADSVYGLPENLAKEIQEECFFPDGLLCVLRRYQEWGVKYILHQEKVLLGDEMGLGKTVQAIAVMVSLRNTGATHFIVVCPASVLTNWCREIRKMSLLSTTKVHGSDRKSAFSSWIKGGGVAVTTYETLGSLVLPDNYKFDLLVVDEAHYIKNSSAQRSINVRNLCLYTDRILFMTGTALENNVDEMISLIKILQPEIAYKVRNMNLMPYAPMFRQCVAPVYYRRKREDVLTELPELIENKEWCLMSKAEERTYEAAIMSKNYAEVRRISWNVEDVHDSSKAKRMIEIIDEAELDGRKVIVFSFFLDTIRKAATILGNRCIGTINGAVTPQRRQEIIDRFEKADAGSVLVSQIQSGGVGLNIQTASVIIICEPQLKPSIENQAISRAYRMGQTRNVLVYRLLCENSVDEKILSRLESKQAIFDAFADESVAANENLSLDDKTLGDIIKEEIDRINFKKEISK